MPIITLNPAPPTPPTAAQLLQQQAGQFQLAAQQEWTRLQNIFAAMAAFVWANPAGASPQQALDSFGTNAADLFNLANAYQAMVAAYTRVAQPSPVPAGWTWVANADGTVTVTPPAGS